MPTNKAMLSKLSTVVSRPNPRVNQNPEPPTVAAHLNVHLYASTAKELRDLISTYNFDYGCRPSIVPTAPGQYMLAAILTQAQYTTLLPKVTKIDVFNNCIHANPTNFGKCIPDNRKGATTVGKGDRFKGGQLFPQGLGSRKEGVQFDLGGFMNVDEVGSAIKGLQKEYGIWTFDLPNKTAANNWVSKGGTTSWNMDSKRYHVYLTAGVHARERGGPDQLIYFISDLLWAQKHGTSLTYGKTVYTKASVLRALSTGIVFFPLVNPDGVHWDQNTDSLWRKNRNPRSQFPKTDKWDRSIGVDINRNYKFIWELHQHVHRSLKTSNNKRQLASFDPADDLFHGEEAFSEAESRNVASVFDTFPRIRWYLDIHSDAGKVYHSWGDDDNQSKDKNQNFHNESFDWRRGILGDKDYGEWISEDDEKKVKKVAGRVALGMSRVAGRTFPVAPASSDGPCSGAGDDYAFSRSQVDRLKNKVYGFTMEFGKPPPEDGIPFYATKPEFQQNVIETGAGLMEFCLEAAKIGLI